jgi:hypothetical protein
MSKSAVAVVEDVERAAPTGAGLEQGRHVLDHPEGPLADEHVVLLQLPGDRALGPVVARHLVHLPAEAAGLQLVADLIEQVLRLEVEGRRHPDLEHHRLAPHHPLPALLGCSRETTARTGRR